MRSLVDLDLLDPDEPFEIDTQAPHLYKHGYEPSDALDAWSDSPLFYEAKPPADWLMVGRIPGDVIVVPLMRPKSGDPSEARPIGIYPASEATRVAYLRDLGQGDR